MFKIKKLLFIYFMNFYFHYYFDLSTDVFIYEYIKAFHISFGFTGSSSLHSPGKFIFGPVIQSLVGSPDLYTLTFSIFVVA